MTTAPSPVQAADNAQQRRLLRQQLLQARLAIPAPVRQAATAHIAEHLTTWLAAHAPQARCIALYSAMRGEVDLSAWAAHSAYALALPVVTGKAMPLAFAAWQPGDRLVHDAYGIAIPHHTRLVAPDVLVIACLGFTPTRLRLGYGGGYYDRTLAALQPRPLAVGIAFAQAHCEFAAQAHDVALDAVITENQVIERAF
jgi:5-formyltetrahydrofolate cyclo-ligase